MTQPFHYRCFGPRFYFIILLFLTCFLGADLSLSVFGETESYFPQVTGWTLSTGVQFYTPETLFYYIDGAADQYIRYGFEELRLAEYRHQQGDLIIVEIYRHSSDQEAFGIYSQEQPPDPSILDIGAMAYLQGPLLGFVAGPYYVRILSYSRGFETREILKIFATGVAEKLSAQTALPPILACFPSPRKQPYSEKYIAGDFLGYSFFPSGFIAAYADSNVSFQIFIMPCPDSTHCHQMLKQYFQTIHRSEMAIAEGHYSVEDPHHGDISLAWKGNFVWGALGLDKGFLQEEYLALTENLLLLNGFIHH